MGSQRIIAYTARSNAVEAVRYTGITNSVALFDESVVHSIQILMDDDEYQSMITTYKQTGEKDYFHADVVIDGVRVDNVGIRLKGNASLRTAMGGGPGGFGRQPGGNPGTNSDSSRVVQIPLMIKFDEYEKGQVYQGYDRVAIRSSGISYNASMLHEPLTNSVFRWVGMPVTRTAYAGIQLNEDAEQLYTISEVIEEDYIKEYFANADGVLYKSEFQATMTYMGDDPSAYARSFTLETRQNDADLGPLIELLKFASTSDDATFERDLDKHLDVDSFATYLAVNNLLVNTDSMAGMGNNFYLYYDDASGKFTVLMWDANESLGKIQGGFGGRGGGGGSSASAASYDLYFKSSSGPGRDNGGGRGGSNALLTRFLASSKFKALYEQKLTLVYQKAFLNGAILNQIETYTATVRAANAQRNFVDENAYEQAVANVIDFINQRGNYLASTPLLGGQVSK